MEVLVCLAHHTGETLPKEQILQAVWAGTIVSDDVLTRSISELADSSADVPFLNCEPTLGFLRSDRRYQGLLRRVGLPQ
jgi:protein gp37